MTTKSKLGRNTKAELIDMILDLDERYQRLVNKELNGQSESKLEALAIELADMIHSSIPANTMYQEWNKLRSLASKVKSLEK